MAKGPVKYSDLFFSDVDQGLSNLNDLFKKLDSTSGGLLQSLAGKNTRLKASLDEIKVSNKELKESLEKTDIAAKGAEISLNNTAKAVEENAKKAKSFKAQQEDVVKIFNLTTASVDEMKQRVVSLTKEYNSLGRETDSDKAKLSSLAKEVKEVSSVHKLLIGDLKEAKTQLVLAENSYALVSSRLNTLKKSLREMPNAINKVTGEWDKSNPAVVKHLKEIEKLDNGLKKMDAAMGNHQRNVGNYKSGYNGLNHSINQLSRELPAFANSMQTGFMAISNNLPMLADEINNLKRANVELVQSGEKPVSVFKSLAGALFSWQTLMSVGITLLTVYGAKLVEWAVDLIDSKKSVDAITASKEALNKALEDGSYKKAIQDVQSLRVAFDLANKGFITEKEAIDQYNESFRSVAGAATSLKEVEQFLIKQSDAFIRITLLKAAANKTLEESAGKMIESEKKIQELEIERNQRAANLKATNQAFAKAKERGNQSEIDFLSIQVRAARSYFNEIDVEYKKVLQTRDNDSKSYEQFAGRFLKQASLIEKASKLNKGENKLISDGDLTSIEQITNRISELKKVSDSGIIGSETNNRIQILKGRLKELNPATVKAAEGFDILNKQLAILETQIEKGLLDGTVDGMDNALAAQYAKVKEQLVKLTKLKDELLNPTSLIQAPGMSYGNPNESVNIDSSEFDKSQRQKRIVENLELLQTLEGNEAAFLNKREASKQRNYLRELEEDKFYLTRKYYLQLENLNLEQASHEEGSKQWAKIERQKINLFSGFQKDKHTILLKAKEEKLKILSEILNFVQENSQLIGQLYGQEYGNFFNSITNSLTEFVKNGKLGFEDWANMAISSIEMVAAQFNQASENRINNYQAEKERELELAGNNKEARELIEAEYNRRIKEEKKKQARTTKTAALIEIAINTAVGASKAVGQAGLLGIPLVPIILALGAVQLGLVAAQPIPEFWKGTKDSPEGFAHLAERGPELIKEPSGKMKLIKDPSIGYLKKGSEVFTAAETAKMLQDMNVTQSAGLHADLSDSVTIGKRNQEIRVMAAALEMNRVDERLLAREIGKEISQLPIANLNLDERGFTQSIRKGNSTVTLLNKKYKM